MIVLDTSVLIDALAGERRSAPELRRQIADGERMALPALVLYEWLRGPRIPAEIAAQEALFPAAGALTFGVEEARVASHLYRTVPRARGREIDLAIAAHALVLEARLWTLNPGDFSDLPGLLLIAAS